MTFVRYPLAIDVRGATATAEEERHVRDLIEQVLLTSPGERVNRPSFGCGLGRMVFEPADDTVAATLRLVVQSALQQWLGTLIVADDVEVAVEEGTLRVTVQYTLRRTGQARAETFERTF